MSGEPMAPAVSPGPPLAGPPGVRWSRQRSLFDRRQAAFWLFLVLFDVTGLSVLTDQLVYLEAFPAGWVFSIVLLALYVLPVALVIYVLDLFEREPLSLLGAAFIWGGIIAVGLAGPINTAWIEIIAKVVSLDVAREWGAALVAPPVEETLKVLGVVTIFLIARDEIDDLIDGFVYGALGGLGFAAVENVQYFVQAIASAGGGDQIGPVISSYLLRVVFAGPYMHVLWSGIAGLGFAYYVTQRQVPQQRRLLVLVGLFAAAVGAHFLWNSPLLGDLVAAGPIGWLLFGLIKGSPFFAFLFVVVRLAQRREHAWFAAATSGHLSADVLTQIELAELAGLRSRWRARRAMGRRKGPAGARLQGRLQKAQIDLALARAKVSDDGDPEVARRASIIRSIRAELEALPDMAAPVYPVPSQPTQPPAQPTEQPQPTQSPLPAQPPPPPPPAAAWLPTHVVPVTGMAAWAAPDPSQPPSASIPAGVPLRVIEVRGAWGRVDAANGWSGWVDGRLLVPYQPFR
ncbi:MAG TPA: PrsW family glutamic-type intramembrane protease [Candidatus Limnocylindrales bacterium]